MLISVQLLWNVFLYNGKYLTTQLQITAAILNIKALTAALVTLQ
jgi:hypothetical protein